MASESRRLLPFWPVFGVGLVSGSVSSLAIKAAYQTQAVGADGVERYFDKPWLMSLVMFVAMALAFPLYWALQRRSSAGGGTGDGLSGRMAVLLAVPSVADLVGSSVQQIGLVLIPVSSFQMLKGSILLFSAVFSVFFLNKHMYKHNRLGVGLCVLALFIVGLASVLSREDQVKVHSLKESLGGICFVILGQVVCASQYVLEEFLLKSAQVPTLALVGLEGLWGLLFMTGLVLPLLHHLPGSDVGEVMENSVDSFVKIANSPDLRLFLGIYFVSCLVFNICGVIVTHQASAVHHTFLDASRTGLIWLGSLYLFYGREDRELGEPLTNFSWLQGLGFALLVFGQLVYDNSVFGEDNVDPENSPVVIRDSMTSPQHAFVPAKKRRGTGREAEGIFHEELTQSLLLD